MACRPRSDTGRLPRAHLGLYGGPLPVADSLFEAGQEGGLCGPYIGHLIPLAHDGSDHNTTPQTRQGTKRQSPAPTSDVSVRGVVRPRPGGVARGRRQIQICGHLGGRPLRVLALANLDLGRYGPWLQM